MATKINHVESMKKSILRFATSMVLSVIAVSRGGAATHYVTPGTSIQAKVNIANPGDTIVIFGGTYSEDVTVNKRISLQRLVGETVFITGEVTLSGITAPAATPMILSNFKIGGDGSKGVTVNSCTNVVVDNVDATGRGFSADNSVNVVVGNSTLTVAELNSSEITLSRATVNDYVRMNNTGRTNRALNLLQCTVPNNFVEATGGKCRLLYNNLRNVRCFSADSVIVGNRIASPQGVLRDAGLVRLQSGVAILRNNDIGSVAGACCFYSGNVNNGVWIADCETLIANNYIHDLGGGDSEGEDDRQAVYIPSASKRIEITGNIFWGTRRGVVGPFANVTYRYNNDVEGVRHIGGVIGDSIISVNPQFVNKTNGNYQLMAGSPCIDAGPSDVWFNDRNGTRNDMGIFGGAAYDPDGKTTDKPITFILQATPLTVIKGVDTNLVIKGGGIVIGK